MDASDRLYRLASRFNGRSTGIEPGRQASLLRLGAVLTDVALVGSTAWLLQRACAGGPSCADLDGVSARLGLAAALIFVCLGIGVHLYTHSALLKPPFSTIVGTWLKTLLVLLVPAAFLLPGSALVAGQTALFAFLGMMALLAGRELLALGIAAAYRGGLLKRFRTAVLARSREDAEVLARRLRGEPDCERVISLPAGARDALDDLVQGGQIDRIVVQAGGMAREDIAKLLQHMRQHVTPAYFVASAPRLAGSERAPEEIGALPVFAVKRGPLTPAERAAKRLFDVLAASLALFTLAPLLLAVAVALRASGARSPFVRVRRRGFDGREFWLLSFADGAGEPGRVRRLLRSTGVDALPQLLNVFAGDLSLVGPRALSRASSDDDRKVARFAAAQGLKPGLAQGSGVTSALGSLPGVAARDGSWHDDLAYLDHWSLGMDIAVLASSLGRMCIVRERQQA